MLVWYVPDVILISYNMLPFRSSICVVIYYYMCFMFHSKLVYIHYIPKFHTLHLHLIEICCLLVLWFDNVWYFFAFLLGMDFVTFVCCWIVSKLSIIVISIRRHSISQLMRVVYCFLLCYFVPIFCNILPICPFTCGTYLLFCCSSILNCPLLYPLLPKNVHIFLNINVVLLPVARSIASVISSFLFHLLVLFLAFTCVGSVWFYIVP